MLQLPVQCIGLICHFGGTSVAIALRGTHPNILPMLSYAARYGCIRNAIELKKTGAVMPLMLKNRTQKNNQESLYEESTCERFSSLASFCHNVSHVFPPANIILCGGTISDPPANFLHQPSLHNLVALELTNLAGLRELPNDFLSGASSASSLVRVVLVGLRDLVRIGENVCSSLSRLQTLQLGNLPYLRLIGNDFATNCPQLVAVLTGVSAEMDSKQDVGFKTKETKNRSQFPSLNQIGHNFISKCPLLVEFDISAFGGVKAVGNSFLAGCNSLAVEMNLTSWTEIRNVGESFMSNCLNMRRIFFPSSPQQVPVETISDAVDVRKKKHRHTKKQQSNAPYCGLESIGSHFLASCRSLDEIDIAALGSALVTLTDGFLCGCEKIKEVSIQSLHSLKKIDADALWNCASLESVTVQSLPNLAYIGNGFASNCPQLKSITFQALPSLMKIGSDVLSGGNSSLQSIAFASLFLLPTAQVSIDANFACNAKMLTTVDFSGIEANISSIGNFFLQNCTHLSSISFAGFSKLSKIGSHFLSGCKKLTSLDLSGCSMLKKIDKYFLFDCKGLTSIDLSGLSCLSTLGAGFALHCTSLHHIKANGVSNVNNIGKDFLLGCSALQVVECTGTHMTLEQRLGGALRRAENESKSEATVKK